MQKSKYIAFILLLIWNVSCVFPQISYARECTLEEYDNSKAIMENQAKSSLQKLNSALSAFNKSAQDYISKCGEPQSMPPYAPNISVAAAAKNLGYDYYENPDSWKYTGYNWMAVQLSSSKNNDCLPKAQEVVQAKYNVTAIDTETAALISASMNPANSGCVCDDQGSMTCSTITDSDEAEHSKGCKQFQEYQQELSVCPLCPIFEVILKTVASISTVAWNAVAGPLANVVKIFFLVLLALEVLKAVAAVSGSKINSFLKGVLVLGLKVAITVLLLSSPKYIYGYFLSPVIEGGLNMGINIATSSGPGANCAVESSYGVSIPSETFTPSVYTSVLSTVKCFGVAASMMPAIGRGLLCYGWDDFSLSLILSGALFYIFGLMIWLAISFYMLDCTVQLGMLSGLIPLLVACWPFRLTEAFTFKGCRMLMNSFFSYAMLGIVLLLGIEIATSAATNDGGNINDIINAINSNDLDTLKELCSLNGFQLLILVSCCIFALKLIGQTSALAGQFSKGSGSEIGNKLGGVATSAATNAVRATASTTGRVATSAGKHVADATGVTAGVNKTTGAIRQVHKSVSSALGKAAGLGKYQNKQTGSGIQTQNNTQGGGGNTSNAGNNTNPGSNPPQPNGNGATGGNNTPNTSTQSSDSDDGTG